MRKKIIYAFGVLISFISVSSILISCSSDEIPSSVEKKDDITVHEQVKNLYDSFESVDTRSSSSSLSFPNYFGGSFVNENSELVVLVIGEPERYRNEFVQRVGSDKFVLKECENTYNDLLAEIDKIDKFFFNPENDHLKESIQFNNYYIDAKNNNILIGLGDCSSSNMEMFKSKVVNSPLFVYEKMENGLARAAGYEVNNLLDYILTGPRNSYFLINNYVPLGADGTSATYFYITLQGKSFYINAFQCANTNPAGQYNMYMYTRTRLTNNYDIGGGIVRQQMGTYSMANAYQDRGILITAPSADAYAMEGLFRKVDL